MKKTWNRPQIEELSISEITRDCGKHKGWSTGNSGGCLDMSSGVVVPNNTIQCTPPQSNGQGNAYGRR